MADVELVIKLDEEYVKQIDRLRLSGGIEDRSLQINVINAIKNGTPLHKGHGRIIDESKITKCEQVGLIIKDDNITRCLKTDAPTIIESK